MLLAFAERLEQLGWLPPSDPRTAKLCTAFGIRPHVEQNIPFYEFCLTGARNERNPWLTLFFHIEIDTRTIRICAAEPTSNLVRRRRMILENVVKRLTKLVQWLDRKDRLT